MILAAKYCPTTFCQEITIEVKMLAFRQAEEDFPFFEGVQDSLYDSNFQLPAKPGIDCLVLDRLLICSSTRGRAGQR